MIPLLIDISIKDCIFSLTEQEDTTVEVRISTVMPAGFYFLQIVLKIVSI